MAARRRRKCPARAAGAEPTDAIERLGEQSFMEYRLKVEGESSEVEALRVQRY